MKNRKMPPVTPDMIQAAENYIMAQAHTSVIRAIVEPIQKQVLLEGQYKAVNDFGPDKERVILEEKDTYLISDADFQEYMIKTRERYVAAKLHVDPNDIGVCPLLVAENLESQARRRVLELAAEKLIRPNVPEFEIDFAYRDPETLKKVTDLTMKILTNFLPKRTGAQMINHFIGKKVVKEG
jgi:hypothetical protein